MSLLPTTTDVALKIAALSNEIIVRIHDLKSDTITDHTPYGAVNTMNCYSLDVISVSQKSIVLGFQSGNEITITFHKKIFTQIGIEAL